MRIIAGIYGKRTIKAPKGLDTRPTIDRVRESVMSSVISLTGTLEDAVFLDAFAGSGAFGIEALSRGAAFSVFCDRSASAIDTIKENLSSLRVSQTEYALIKTDILKSGIPYRGRPYSIAYFDPPYATEADKVIDLITDGYRRACFEQDCLFLYEHATDTEERVLDALTKAGLVVVKQKCFGKTQIDFMCSESV